MKTGFVIRLFFILFFVTLFLYYYVDKQNQITKLRLQLPALEKEVKELRKETVYLNYQVETLESPQNLLYFLTRPEYSHLKFSQENAG